MQPKPEFLNPDDFPEPHMESAARVSEAERLAHWLEFLHDDNTLETHAAAEMRRLAAEVERLRDELCLCCELKRGYQEQIGELAAEVEALRAMLREARDTIDTLPGYPKSADLCDRIDAIDAAKASAA